MVVFLAPPRLFLTSATDSISTTVWKATKSMSCHGEEGFHQARS